jgi:O-antigen ligase
VLGTATFFAVLLFVLHLSLAFVFIGLLAACVLSAIVMRPLWGFYALVATFSAEHLLGLSDVLTTTKLLGALVVLGWALDAAIRRRYRVPRARILLGAPVLLGSAIVSMVAVENVISGAEKLATIVQLNLLVLVAATLLQSIRDVRRLAWVLLLSTALSAVLGLTMFAAGRQENLEGLATNRNAIGMFLAMCIPMIVFFYSRVGMIGKAALVALAGMFFVCEALSYSREGFIFLVVAVVLSFLLGARGQRLKIGVLMLGLGIPIAVSLPSQFWQRVSTIEPAIEAGSETVGLRYQLWDVALRMIRTHPILGVGPGNYYAHFMRYGGVLGMRRVPLACHNAYLGVTAELGLVGGSLFVAICLTALVTYAHAGYLASRRGDKEVTDLAICFGISTLVFILAGLVGNMEFMKYFWLLIALSAVLNHLAKAAPLPETAPAVESARRSDP